MMKYMLFAPVLLIAPAGQAIAQTAATSEQGGQTSDEDSSEPAKTVSQETEGLQEIVVTAERRADSVQRSSLSIQVLGKEALDTVARPQDLTTIAPGLQVGSAGPNAPVYIRGVGDTASNSRSQGAIAFNVDGIYYGRGSAVTPSFFDLERIEVLKGPQGTLYGRNATGGAVNLITAAPRLGEFAGYVEGALGSFDLRSVEGALNVPIGKTLALRASGQIISRDGYTSDGGQDQDTKSLRARLLWQPSDAVSLLINGDLSSIDGQGGGVVILPVLDGNPWRSNTAPPFAYPFTFGAGTAPYTTPNDRYIRTRNRGISGELNVDLGFATASVLPAYRKQKQEYVSYNSNFRFSETLDDNQTSTEVRLSNNGDRLKWLVGAYYFDNSYFVQADPSRATLANATQFNVKIRSKAAFGQATLTIADPLRVIGGLRYTHERFGGTFQYGRGAFPLVPFTATGGVIPIDPIEANKVNWKAGFEFDVARQSMLYATASTGFKGGGFQPTPGCGSAEFAAEELTAYQIGSRNRFFGNKLQVNAEAFHWKYDNQQVSSVTLDRCGGNSLLTRNVGESTISGGNLDLTFQLSRSDTLHAFVEYAHGTYDRFSFSQLGLGTYAPSGGTRCSSTATGGGFFNIDCSGLQVTRLPKWVGQVDYRHVFDLGDRGTVTASANAQFASQRWLDITYGPNGRADGYTSVGADLVYRSANDRLSLSVYVRNLLKDQIYTSGTTIPTALPNGTFIYTAAIEAPRSVGVRLRLSY